MAKKYAPKLMLPVPFDEAVKALLNTPVPATARRKTKPVAAKKRAARKQSKAESGRSSKRE